MTGEKQKFGKAHLAVKLTLTAKFKDKLTELSWPNAMILLQLEIIKFRSGPTGTRFFFCIREHEFFTATKDGTVKPLSHSASTLLGLNKTIVKTLLKRYMQQREDKFYLDIDGDVIEKGIGS